MSLFTKLAARVVVPVLSELELLLVRALPCLTRLSAPGEPTKAKSKPSFKHQDSQPEVCSFASKRDPKRALGGSRRHLGVV
jgi:hypothetical protein